MKEIKLWDKAIRQVESVKIIAEKNCASKFDFSFDRESFLLETQLSYFDNNEMRAYCGDTFAAIDELCADADYYTALANVKSVSCAFDKNIASPETSLDEGHLRFAFNWDTSSHRESVKDYLKKTL